MALYNTIFGECPHATYLLHQRLNLRRGDLPRYRDCFLHQAAGKHPLIVLFLRTGGANRPPYANRMAFDLHMTGDLLAPSLHGEPIRVPRVFNDDLERRADFVQTTDDRYDATYAWFFFQSTRPIPSYIASDPKAYRDPSTMWADLCAKMDEPGWQVKYRADPAVQNAVREGERIMQAMEAAIKTSSVTVVDT